MHRCSLLYEFSVTFYRNMHSNSRPLLGISTLKKIISTSLITRFADDVITVCALYYCQCYSSMRLNDKGYIQFSPILINLGVVIRKDGPDIGESLIIYSWFLMVLFVCLMVLFTQSRVCRVKPHLQI